MTHENEYVWSQLPTRVQEHIYALLLFRAESSRRYHQMAANMIVAMTDATWDAAVELVQKLDWLKNRISQEERMRMHTAWNTVLG